MTRCQAGHDARVPKRLVPCGGWGMGRPLTWVSLALVFALLVGSLYVLAGGSSDAYARRTGASGGRTGPDFHSLVADPTTPGRIFVGGHEAVSESRDGSATWSRVRSLDNADAMGWGFSTDAIFVSGHPGLNRSTDGGRTFVRINQGLPGTDVHAFGTGRAVFYGAATDAGVFASIDNGRSWQSRNAQMGQSFFGRIVVDPADDNHLYVADTRAGVAESNDGGRAWHALKPGLPIATWLSRSGDGLVLVASGPAGAVRSTDGGRSWDRLTLPSGASLVEIDPRTPTMLYAGTHRGTRVTVAISSDDGRTWRSAK